MPEAIHARPVPTSYFQLILRRFGDTPAARTAILRGTGITEAQISDSQVAVSFAQQLRQFENMERLHGEGWALIAPDIWRPAAHGTLGVAVVAAPTVGAAVEIVVRYISTHTPHQHFKLVRGSSSVSLRHTVSLHLTPGHWRTVVEAVFLGVGATLGILLGHARSDVRYEFAWPEPSYGDRLKEALAGHVLWDAPANSIVIPNRLLSLRSPLADAALFHHALERLEQVASMGAAPLGVKSRVEQILARSDNGRCALSSVAKALGLSQRTLARRLADAGVTYRDLVDAELKSRAGRWLEAGVLSRGEIGERLGFADATGFSRACRRWFRSAA
jgi:AraC-like DNA-binding protein